LLRQIEQREVYGIRKPLTSVTGSEIVSLFEFSQIELEPELVSSALRVSISCHLSELRASAFIKSLDVGEFPDFELTDTQSQQIAKVGFARWGQARKHMKVMLGDSSGWSLINIASFTNPQLYPLESINLLPFYASGVAFPIGTDFKLGVQMEDAGYDLLMGADLISVFGAVTVEIQIITEDLGSFGGSSVVVTPLLPP